MSKLYLDSETCGLHGYPVLLQHASESSPVHLVDVWKQPVAQTLRLVEAFTLETVVGFNLAFDWFHLVKLWTTWRLLPGDWIPERHIGAIAAAELDARDGDAIKPAGALDLMLHSRKGTYQALMSRDPIRIRRVPTPLAEVLAAELENRVEIDGIYFARRSDPDAPKWKVFDHDDNPDLKDVVLTFHPAGGLKFLAEHALGKKPKYHFTDVELDPVHRPIEYGYAPTASAVSSVDRGWAVLDGEKIKGYAWPGVIQRHIDHWATNANAREYAADDVIYTRELDAHFGYPTPNDDDSVLACMVPVIRWRGFEIETDGMSALLAQTQKVIDAAPVNINSTAEVRAYLSTVMDETEQLVIADTTKKERLEAIATWNDGQHTAAVRAKELLAVKTASKEKELYEKLLHAGRFHTSFNVIGAKSSRMSGSDGLNPQGIKATDTVRRLFPLAWPGSILSGGDFDSFEVTLADAEFDDPGLRKDLLSGKKIHGLFGMALNPGKSYDDILATKGTENDLYDQGKRGFFGGIMYMGGWETLVHRLGKHEDIAKAAFNEFSKRYKKVSQAQGAIRDTFGALRQTGGIGTAVVWHEPADYVETFLGFRRYFTLENKIMRALFDLARKPPVAWRQCKIPVVRRDRVQTAGGAVSSALYGAAFAIQGANIRAAGNHKIQSPGGQITKRVQRKIWDLQPVGVAPLVVAPMNVHDELMVVNRPDYSQRVADQVAEAVEFYRPHVPLIGMTWFLEMANWSEKKAGSQALSIAPPKT